MSDYISRTDERGQKKGEIMSVSKWAYTPEKCDGQPCPGDCDHCAKQSLYEMKEFLDGIGLKDATGLMDAIVPKMIKESEGERRKCE